MASYAVGKLVPLPRAPVTGSRNALPHRRGDTVDSPGGHPVRCVRVKH